MKPNKRVRWAQDKRNKVMHIVKNAVWIAFYCVQVRVHKRAEPVRVGGLSDWLRTELTQQVLTSPDHHGYCCLHSAGWGCSFCGRKREKPDKELRR